MAKVTEFYEAAIVLANADLVDAMMRMWMGFNIDNDWVAALSVEDRAEFLNFPDSLSTTIISDSNNPDIHMGPNWDQEDTELEPEVIPNPNPEIADLFDAGMTAELTKRMKFGLIYGAGPAALDAMLHSNMNDEIDPRQEDHINQVWTGRP